MPGSWSGKTPPTARPTGIAETFGSLSCRESQQGAFQKHDSGLKTLESEVATAVNVLNRP